MQISLETTEAAKRKHADEAGLIRAQAVAGDAQTPEKEGRKPAANVLVKLPLTQDGLNACQALSTEGIKTDVTQCFSANQALMAATAGASFTSPFVGQLDDMGFDGKDLIRDIRPSTRITASTLRSWRHRSVQQAMFGGLPLVDAGCATIPPSVLEELFKHPLTDKELGSS